MIFISTLILAISSSIDSFGIGITYGLKSTKISKLSKLILFVISIVITSISVIIGNLLKTIFSVTFAKLIGSLILIFMGLFIIIKSNNKEYSFDLNNSNDIDYKEALLLGIALSLDSLCIGICGSTIGINNYLFSFLVAILQYLFLSLGNLCGTNIINFKFIPQSVWTKISGILLIFISIFRI